MLPLSLFLIILGAFQSIFIQAEMITIYEDIIFPYADKEYFKVYDTYLTNDNALAANFSIINPLPTNIDCRLYMMGSSMGEYVVPSGIDVEMGLCEMLEEPIVLGPLLDIFGFNKDECPPLPGPYGTEGYTVPTDNFPDDFPPNQYLFILDMSVSGKLLLSAHVSLTVQ